MMSDFTTTEIREIEVHLLSVLEEVSLAVGYNKTCEFPHSTISGIEHSRNFNLYSWILADFQYLDAWAGIVLDDYSYFLVVTNSDGVHIFHGDSVWNVFEAATFDSPFFEDVSADQIVEWYQGFDF